MELDTPNVRKCSSHVLTQAVPKVIKMRQLQMCLCDYSAPCVFALGMNSDQLSQLTDDQFIQLITEVTAVLAACVFTCVTCICNKIHHSRIHSAAYRHRVVMTRWRRMFQSEAADCDVRSRQRTRLSRRAAAIVINLASDAIITLAPYYTPSSSRYVL